MALFRNLCVNLRDFLCDVPNGHSAQSLDLTRGTKGPSPFGAACGASYSTECGIVLDLAKNASFLDWKLTLAPNIMI